MIIKMPWLTPSGDEVDLLIDVHDIEDEDEAEEPGERQLFDSSRDHRDAMNRLYGVSEND